MKLNNKGYSMIELFAVIFIASAIIFPMVTTLVNNFEINDRIHNRRSSLSISQGTLEAFSRFDFVDIQALVNDANTSNKNFVEFDELTCTQLASASDRALCVKIFESTVSNYTLTDSTFKVYIFNYNLTTIMQSDLVGDGDIPPRLQTEIQNMTTTNDPNPELYNIYVWIEYDTDTSSTLILGGLIAND